MRDESLPLKIIKYLLKLLEFFIMLIRDLLTSINNLTKAKSLLQLREKSITSLKEFVDLLDVLGSEDDIPIRALFVGFSAESIHADRATLYSYEDETKTLYTVLTMRYKDGRLIPYDYYSETKDLVIKPGEDSCGYSIISKKPVLIITSNSTEKIYKGILDKKIKMKINSIIDVPLITENKIVGVLEIANSIDNRVLNEIDLYTVSIIARLATISMEKAKLYEWSIKDNLTHLFNYHYLQVSLEKEISRAKRYPKDVSMIMLDIDNFKKINDNYGHQAGNMVLTGISEIIRNSIRNNIDIPVRYGGDEFLIILPETDIKGAESVAKRLLSLIREKEFKYQKDNIKATVSIGITSARKGEIIKKDAIIKRADKAMYEAKKKGKNRIEIWT